MKKLILPTIITLGALSSFAMAAESIEEKLITAQDRVIQLQEELMSAQRVKTYEADEICYDTKRECYNRRAFVNLLSNDQVSVLSECSRVYTDDNTSDCSGWRWMLSTKIRILK